MKKKFFLIGALVAMSMSAMFVACSSKNDPTNGCNCTIRESDGSQSSEYFSKMDMAEVGATTCAALASSIQTQYLMMDRRVTVMCE